MSEPGPGTGAAGAAGRGDEAPLLAAPPQAWLELFYDLVFVAAIVLLSTSYSHDAAATSTAWVGIVFAMIWATWLATTLLTNRVRLAGTLLRVLLVTQMLGVLALVLVSTDLGADESYLNGTVFLGIMVVLAAMYANVRRGHPELREDLRWHTGRCLAVGAGLAVASFVDAWVLWVPLWVAALLVLVLPGRRRGYYEALEPAHLRHRFGEFTLIMLGETFVKIGLVAAEEPLADLDLVVLPISFVLVFAIWWLYFTDVPASGIPASAGRRTTWMLLHFPLHLGVVALAVGLAKLLPGDAPAAHGAPGSIRFLPVPLLLITLALAGLNALADGPQHVRRRDIHLVASAALAVIGVLAFTVDPLPQVVTALLFTAVVVAAAVATRRFAVAALEQSPPAASSH